MNAVTAWILSVALSVPIIGSPEGPAAGFDAPRADGCAAAVDAIRDLPPGEGAPPAWAGSDVPEPLWRLAEAALEAGERARQICLFREAEAEARALLDADSTDLGARFGLAAVLGLRADREEGKDLLRTASALYVELERILATDSEHARARHALGRLQAGIMRMSGMKRFVATKFMGGEVLSRASWKGAEENLAWAERTMPDVIDHHYEMAHLYIDTDRPTLAVEELAHVLSHEPRSAMERDTHRKAVDLLTSNGT